MIPMVQSHHCPLLYERRGGREADGVIVKKKPERKISSDKFYSNTSQLPPPAFAKLIPGTPSFIKKETPQDLSCGGKNACAVFLFQKIFYRGDDTNLFIYLL